MSPIGTPRFEKMLLSHTVKCTLISVRGEALAFLYPAKTSGLSMCTFFSAAKRVLRSEGKIKLVIGKTAFSEESQGAKFFSIKDVEDAISEHGEVTITAIISSDPT